MATETDRAALAAEARIAPEKCCPGPRTELTGSLASGTADAFSGIGIAWWCRTRGSRTALANAVGAVKAVARQRDDEARALLDRGFARIGEDDRATGDRADDVARLARDAVLPEASLTGLAARVAAFAARHLGSGGASSLSRGR